MKKFAFLPVFLFFQVLVHAFQWIPLCPDSIHATNLCFGLGSGSTLICTPDGMYLYEDDIEWHYYSYGGLPVIDAAPLSPEKILVVMGDGTYSDGIYTFDLQSHEFAVVEWVYKPSFIRYYEFADRYFTGLEEGGLLLSTNGTTWYTIGYFDTIPCCDIGFYENNVVVSEGSYEINNLFLSSDAGINWNKPINAGYFAEIEFSPQGNLYAVFPGMSNSAGIYHSQDFGFYWEPMNWEFFITCLGVDAIGNVFVGWENGNGIAMLDPTVPPFPEFVFLNEGLPDTHVHAIKRNPALSSITIFACTSSGVYSCHDYLMEVGERSVERGIGLFPNPAREQGTLNLHLPSCPAGAELRIFDGNGNVVLYRKLNEQSNMVNLTGIAPGLYGCSITEGGITRAEKLIIH